MNRKKRKIKKVSKNELKKVKGGYDVYELFKDKALGQNTGAPGTSAVVDVGSHGAVTFGIKIKWS
jgi:bacteriocin-like protein